MHLICHNVAQQLWDMIRCVYGEECPLFLRKKYRNEISQTIKDTHLSSALFDGKLIGKGIKRKLGIKQTFAAHEWTLFVNSTDITSKPGHARAVDWTIFLVYVIPTYIIHQIDRQHQGGRKKTKSTVKANDSCKKALIALVKACSISLRYEISTDDIQTVKRSVYQCH